MRVAAQAVSGGGSADTGRREPDGRGVLSACPGSDGGQTEVLPVAFARGALGSVWGARSLEAPRGPWAAASRWRPQAGACAPSSPVPPAQPSSVTGKLQTRSPVLVFDRDVSTPGTGQSGDLCHSVGVSGRPGLLTGTGLAWGPVALAQLCPSSNVWATTHCRDRHVTW